MELPLRSNSLRQRTLFVLAQHTASSLMRTESAENQRRLFSFPRTQSMAIGLPERYAAIESTRRRNTGNGLSATSNRSTHRWTRTHSLSKWRIMVPQRRHHGSLSARTAITGKPPHAFNFCLKHAAFEFLTQPLVRLSTSISSFRESATVLVARSHSNFWVPVENSEAPVFLYLHGQDATKGKNLEHTERFHQWGWNVLVINYA